jgi:NIMA (never in mitosis gene a)-related kinase 1/4/5
LHGLAKYEHIKPIGQGSAGTVSMYKNKVDGNNYALKEIDLTFMSEKDKKSAQNEVQFLRVLKGPTIVTFYESFSHKKSIFIVMELAVRGNLDTAIQQKIISGTKFPTHQIIRYLAHVVMAVMAMFNKNILHRDIKTQNIFITQSGILKLGDFGISRELHSTNAKAQTACGTPYFMPPEVCLGKPYDHKADVWAVGVILYEMIMLKKPFESDSINGVLSQITSCAYEPLSQEVDPNLKMLVVALLNKDFNKRPSIIEVANIPCVRKEILDFIEENDIQD